MDDILKKLAQIQASAPKAVKKKLTEDTSKRELAKKPTLKDVFNQLSEAVAPGQKPLPVMDPTNKKAGMGFVTSTNPSVQNILKNLDPKDVQIVQAPGAPGAAPAAGQQTTGAVGTTQGGQGTAMGAGQQQMREGETQECPHCHGTGGHDRLSSKHGYHTVPCNKCDGTGEVDSHDDEHLDERDEGKPGKNFAKIAKSAGERYGSKAAGERVAGAVRAKLAKQGKLEETNTATTAQGGYVVKDGTKVKKFKTLRAAKAYAEQHGGKVSSEEAYVPEGAKVDRMVKHIEKSERDLGNSKDTASDIAWATANKRGMLDNKNKKVEEGSRSVASASKKHAATGEVAINKAERAVRKGSSIESAAREFDLTPSEIKKLKERISTQKVKEADIPSSAGIDNKGAGLGAGRSPTTLEGKTMNKKAKPDFLDMDKDGNKKEPMKKAVADKKKKPVKEGMSHRIAAARHEGRAHGLKGAAHCGKNYDDMEESKAYHMGYKDGLDECYGMGVYEAAPAMPPATIGGMADDAMDEGKFGKAALALGGAAALAAGGGMAKGAYDYHKKDPAIGMSQSDMDLQRGGGFYKEGEMEEGNAFTAGLAKTPKGGKFSVGGKTFTDRSSHDAKIDEFAFESWSKQLKNLINEGEVTEGLSVSVSKGNHGAEDSVNINATGPESEQLMAIVKSAGLGIFGSEEPEAHSSSAMSIQPVDGGEPEANIDVVDGSDGMLSLMKKLGGVEQAGMDAGEGEDDYADEEGCDSCGAASCECGDEEQVDEVESEDQQEFEVAENAPDTGADNSEVDVQGNAAANNALATADAGEDEEEGMQDQSVQESDDEEEDDLEESFTFESFYKKLAFLESTEKEDKKAEKAGKKVTKDIEYDDKKDKKEKVDEWANKAGPGNTVSDTTFEQDIDFMTKVIAGGLNKPKSTGQTTIPVVAHQEDRMHDSPKDWATLAGIKK
jgi:hypothetical protein